MVFKIWIDLLENRMLVGCIEEVGRPRVLHVRKLENVLTLFVFYGVLTNCYLLYQHLFDFRDSCTPLILRTFLIHIYFW